MTAQHESSRELPAEPAGPVGFAARDWLLSLSAIAGILFGAAAIMGLTWWIMSQ